MERAEYDLYIYKGEDYLLTTGWKIDKEPIDFTGWTAAIQIRRGMNGGLIAEMECDIEAVEGKIDLTLQNRFTAALNPGTYAWDLKLTDEGGTVWYPLTGKCYVYGRSTE